VHRHRGLIEQHHGGSHRTTLAASAPPYSSAAITTSSIVCHHIWFRAKRAGKRAYIEQHAEGRLHNPYRERICTSSMCCAPIAQDATCQWWLPPWWHHAALLYTMGEYVTWTFSPNNNACGSVIHILSVVPQITCIGQTDKHAHKRMGTWIDTHQTGGLPACCESSALAYLRA
jgi:hypothetical protein